MTKFKLFENIKFGKIRVVILDNDPWFVAQDIANILDFYQISSLINNLDKALVKKISRAEIPMDENLFEDFGENPVRLISEYGFCHTIFFSYKPNAIDFFMWIAKEVLPRLNNYERCDPADYIEQIIANPDFAIKILAELKQEREKKIAFEQKTFDMQKTIDEMRPKYEYCENILSVKSAIPISVIAHEYGYNAQQFNLLLQSSGVQYKCGISWLLNEKYRGLGYTCVCVKNNIKVVDNSSLNSYTTSWTLKGRYFIYEFLKERGIVPTLERNMVG